MYNVILKIDGKYYLLLNYPNDNNRTSIVGFSTLEKTVDLFSGYTDQFRKDYTSSMSATIGMMNIQPFAVECNDPEKYRDYVISDVCKINVQTSGKFYVVEVKKEIEEWRVLDIWQECIKTALN